MSRFCSRPYAIFPVAVLATLAGCARSSSSTENADSNPDLMRVSVVTPIRKTLERHTEQPAQIQAFAEAPVFAKVSGYVKKRLVDIGDRVEGPVLGTGDKIVRQGDVLAELWAPEYDEEAKQKRAQVLQTEAEVEQSKSAVTVAKSAEASAVALVGEAKSAGERAEASYARWKSEFGRIAQLAASKAVTQKVADETEQQFRAADAARQEVAARVKSAEAKAAEAGALVEKAAADLKATEAKLLVAKADEQRVQALCEYLTLRAPFTGTVTVRNIDTGHLVHAGKGGDDKPQFVVVSADTVRIFMDVPEADAALIAKDADATIRPQSLGGTTFPGRVTRTSWALHAGTRTLRVEIDIPNSEGTLRPGMYATVDLIVARREDALALPAAAVVVQDRQASCLRVDDTGKLVRTPIQVGIRAGNEIEVISGLEGTERVVAANVAAYRDGQQVEVAGAGK